ncbi:MAG: hypothetical protein ACI81W_004076, partial [Saprospiraceae bacterium]
LRKKAVDRVVTLLLATQEIPKGFNENSHRCLPADPYGHVLCR